MAKIPSGFVSIALTPEVVVASLKISLVVGTLLALINHGTAIIQFTLTSQTVVQIALTYLVPYSVATYSSVNAIRRRQ